MPGLRAKRDELDVQPATADARQVDVDAGAELIGKVAVDDALP